MLNTRNAFDYDLLVIGGGSGGVRGGRIAASLGARVAVVEDTHWGGTCVNVGCVPKKMYHYLASCVDDIHIAKALGFHVEVQGLNWTHFFQSKEKEIQRLQGVYQRILKNSDVEIINGRGQLVDAHTLDVGGQQYTAKNILLAVGGAPVKPDIDGAEYSMTSDELFAMERLPESLLVVGGGYIGCELASTFNKLGVNTELVVRSQLLRAFDTDAAAFVEQEMLAEELSITKGVSPVNIRLDGEMNLVRFDDGSEKSYEKVLFATGRSPRFEGLGLENTGIVLTKHGLIQVNDDYQTTEPSIYAVGDIVPGPELTPVALAQGMHVARKLFSEKTYKAPDLGRVPTTIFTHPQLASVGAPEQMLKNKKVPYQVFESSFGLLRTSITDYRLRAYIKLLVHNETDEILGVHLAGPEVGEVLQGFAVCVQARMTKAQLDETIGIHPTYAEELVTMRAPSRVELV